MTAALPVEAAGRSLLTIQCRISRSHNPTWREDLPETALLMGGCQDEERAKAALLTLLPQQVRDDQLSLAATQTKIWNATE